MASLLSIEEWGPKGWGFIHAVSFAYPATPTDSEKAQMHAFITSIGDVLPCKVCRAHFQTKLSECEFDAQCAALQSQQALTKFVVDVHNDVNRRLHKRAVPYETVAGWYQDPVSMCPLRKNADADTALENKSHRIVTIQSAVLFVQMVIIGVIIFRFATLQRHFETVRRDSGAFGDRS